MKNSLFFIAFNFGLLINIYGQDLSQYEYVQVPDKFEFLKEENQYKLNALTAFLFEKYGFEALYKKPLPAGVNACNVLKAEVHNKSALFRSRVYVTLEDCKGQTVFTSKVGSSREKDFERSYHEALREAFTSFEGVRENPVVVIDPVPEENVNSAGSKPSEVVVDPVPDAEEVQGLKEDIEVIIDPVVGANERKSAKEKGSPTKDLRQFMNGPYVYYLKPTSVGFELYRQGQEQKFGTLLRSGGGENFLYTSEKISGNAFFDTAGNLMIEYLDPVTEQLLTVKYELKAQ